MDSNPWTTGLRPPDFTEAAEHPSDSKNLNSLLSWAGCKLTIGEGFQISLSEMGPSDYTIHILLFTIYM